MFPTCPTQIVTENSNSNLLWYLVYYKLLEIFNCSKIKFSLIYVLDHFFLLRIPIRLRVNNKN